VSGKEKRGPALRQLVEDFRGKTLVKLVSPLMGKEVQKQGKGKQRV